MDIDWLIPKLRKHFILHGLLQAELKFQTSYDSAAMEVTMEITVINFFESWSQDCLKVSMDLNDHIHVGQKHFILGLKLIAASRLIFQCYEGNYSRHCCFSFVWQSCTTHCLIILMDLDWSYSIERNALF